MNSPLPTGSTTPLATLSQRLIGQILDSLIAVALFTVFALLSALIRMVSEPLAGVPVIVGAVIFIAYLFFSDALPGGQSWGKRILKIAVVDAQTGAPCGPGKAFVRNFLLYILGIIDWVFIFGTKNRQRLGDLAAGTLVIKVPQNDSSATQ